VARAVQIIRPDLAKSVLVEDIAAACGQSLRRLRRKLQAAFGISPQVFLIKTRVLLAARIRESTKRSIGEIAAMCGFPDKSGFFPRFRKRTGQTPRAYRNKPQSSGRPPQSLAASIRRGGRGGRHKAAFQKI
jgi:AraC-like DNA-binding protein